ncbi:hypothetical protein HK096_003472 [Nowakowskiella sp. JEL0078]|nr:hypothetical protein HK096_003472 [Nowakowskiella sp. JEL0078]
MVDFSNQQNSDLKKNCSTVWLHEHWNKSKTIEEEIGTTDAQPDYRQLLMNKDYQNIINVPSLLNRGPFDDVALSEFHSESISDSIHQSNKNTTADVKHKLELNTADASSGFQDVQIIISPADERDNYMTPEEFQPQNVSMNFPHQNIVKGFLSPLSALMKSHQTDGFGKNNTKVSKTRKCKDQLSKIVIPADMPYTAQMPDELHITIGDLMTIESAFHDGKPEKKTVIGESIYACFTGWMSGKNHTTGKTGVFPSFCLAPPYNEPYSFLCPIHLKLSGDFLYNSHAKPRESFQSQILLPVQNQPEGQSEPHQRTSVSSRISTRSSSLKIDIQDQSKVIVVEDDYAGNTPFCTCPIYNPDINIDETSSDKFGNSSEWSWQPSEGRSRIENDSGNNSTLSRKNQKKRVRQSRRPFGIYNQDRFAPLNLKISRRMKIIISVVVLGLACLVIGLGVSFGQSTEEDKVIIDDSQYSPSPNVSNYM